MRTLKFSCRRSRGSPARLSNFLKAFGNMDTSITQGRMEGIKSDFIFDSYIMSSRRGTVKVAMQLRDDNPNQCWYLATPGSKTKSRRGASGCASWLGGGIKDPHLLPTFPQCTNPDDGTWLSLDILDIQQLVLLSER